MYAAAGGASLASRQARQKQRKQNKNDRLQQLKSQKATDLGRQPQGRQFHNYTDPSTVKLSRVERNALKPPPVHPERRHSTHSTSHLREPSRARIRESPSVLIPLPNHLNQPPQPLTPCTLVQNHAPLHPSPSLQSQLPQIFIPEEGNLERRCSFVRQVEEMEKCQEGGLLDRCNHICNFEIKDKGWDNNLTYYSEFHKSAFGSLEYPFSECSQGRAAWQERQGGRRCSLSEEAQQHRLKQVEAHHRWMKRNRIHDTTYGGDSEEDFFNVYHQSAAANALLYVGLGTSAIGSVVFFVGSGDKGFKTLELRLIGPTLIACGLLCCLIRILLCACPSTCVKRKKKTRLKNVCPHSTSASRFPLERRDKTTSDFVQVDPGTSLLSKQKKRVSIAPPGPGPGPSTSRPSLPTLQHEHEARKQTIPIISVPELGDFSPVDGSTIELQHLELSYDMQSVSSNDSDTFPGDGDAKAATARTRVPVHANLSPEDVETCLSIVVERSDNSECSGDRSEPIHKGANDHPVRKSHSGIVLSPLQLGQ